MARQDRGRSRGGLLVPAVLLLGAAWLVRRMGTQAQAGQAWRWPSSGRERWAWPEARAHRTGSRHDGMDAR